MEWQVNHKLNNWVEWTTIVRQTMHVWSCMVHMQKSCLWVSHRIFFSQYVVKCEDLIDPMIIWLEVLKITVFFYAAAHQFGNNIDIVDDPFINRKKLLNHTWALSTEFLGVVSHHWCGPWKNGSKICCSNFRQKTFNMHVNCLDRDNGT